MKNFIVLVMFLLTASCIGEEKKKVLVIESYHAEYLWDMNYEKGLKEKLGAGYDIDFFYMDTKRLPKDEHPRMATKAIETFHSTKPDYVIVADDAALKYTGPRLARADVPVIFLGINNNPQNYLMQWPINLTGVLERPLLYDSIATVKKILPQTKRISILFDTDLTAQVIKSDLFGNQNSVTVGDVTVDIVMLESYSQWQHFVAETKNRYDVCIMGLYQNLKDNAGAIVNAEDVAVWTSSNAPVPLFAFWDFTVGATKAVGGLVVSGVEQGRMAGEIVEKLRAGAKPADITPMTGGNGELLFSKAQLEKHKLRLPTEIQQSAQFVD